MRGGRDGLGRSVQRLLLDWRRTVLVGSVLVLACVVAVRCGAQSAVDGALGGQVVSAAGVPVSD